MPTNRTRLSPASRSSVLCGAFLSLHLLPVLTLLLGLGLLPFHAAAAESDNKATWRQLPLIADGKIDPSWMHLGWGKFVVDGDALRTECDAKGLGLLVYQKERLGNCQLRIVYRQKESKCNAGVYVRIDEGILKQAGNPGAAFTRNAAGEPSDESMEKMKTSAEREDGPWFAVHRGYEVQIAEGGDSFHRTGAIYSLAPSKPTPPAPADGWRTMVITLNGDKIQVEVDGAALSELDTTSPKLPERKYWHEPKREPKRPQVGYIGLQNHDPGDVVWFREVSVRPLPK
jgi:hypothetical protein